MNDKPQIGVRRLAAALIALAALFHVQWVAACDAFPRADARTCCAEGGAGAQGNCDHESNARSCLSPFGKTATATKLSERIADTDDPPNDLPLIVQVSVSGPTARTDNPAWRSIGLTVPDGRFLYLTSSRLRL